MQQPQDITTIQYRVEALETGVRELQQQLHSYVSTRENDLQLQNIRGTVERIERDVQDTKKQMMDLSTKISVQDTEAQRRDADQRKNQDALQIRMLWVIVSAVGTVLIGVLVTYLSQVIHP